MKNNDKLIQDVHPLIAKYSSLCTECMTKINVGDPVVFLSEFKVTLHWNCFYQCNVLSFETDLLTNKKALIIDPKLSIKTLFCTLAFRLKRKKAKHVTPN